MHVNHIKKQMPNLHNAACQLGKKSDISIKRVGAGKASAVGDFNFEGTVNVKKGLKVNGVDCKCGAAGGGGGDTDKLIKSLQEQINLLQNMLGNLFLCFVLCPSVDFTSLFAGIKTGTKVKECTYPKDSFQWCVW